MAGMPADQRRPPAPEITSPANARVKRLVALRRRREREQAGVTLVEGQAEVDLALNAGVAPHEVYFCPELASIGASHVADKARERGADVIRVTRPVFEKFSYREGPDGLLAVVPAVPTDLHRIELGPRPLVLVCAGLEKPGNLGAVLRTADAAGVAAVIAADPVTDWGNPNVVRASKGTVFSVPVASATGTQVLDWLRDRGLRLVAASPDATRFAADEDLTAPTAIAVGAEQAGLPADWLDRADATVRIPMFGRADSLNVSISAAILVYEAVRQRIAAGDLNYPLPVR
jgi:RNA methyltransferase, TrmH family